MSMWLCTTDAPAARHAIASAAISSGERGALGLRSFVVAPLMAASMITSSAIPLLCCDAGTCCSSAGGDGTVREARKEGRARTRMFIDLTSEQRALQVELRAYFGGLMTPERRRVLTGGESGGAAYRDLVREIGHDGWLGVGWPREYGGQGRTPLEQYIFFDEANRVGVPMPLVTLNTVGPTLMRYGSEEQKSYFLPRILAGELHFAIGYTEPGAGTDLASLRTRAVRDGDEYVINGNKVFTTGAHDADWVWLACRTNPDAPKHKGISIILVPTTADGFKHSPIWLLGGGHTNATYYEDVRVPVGNVVLGENEGWKLITSQLNHERVALAAAGRIDRHFQATLRWARETRLADGTRVVDRE